MAQLPNWPAVTGADMRLIRQQCRLTEVQLAYALGYRGSSRALGNTIRRFENGKRVIPPLIAKLTGMFHHHPPAQAWLPGRDELMPGREHRRPDRSARALLRQINLPDGMAHAYVWKNGGDFEIHVWIDNGLKYELPPTYNGYQVRRVAKPTAIEDRQP
jgi:hypothetical protein